MKKLKKLFVNTVKGAAILLLLLFTLYMSTAFGGIGVAWYLEYSGVSVWLMTPSCALLVLYTWYFLLYRGTRHVIRSRVI